MPERKPLDLQSPPSFILPLKRRTPPEGYECCMSCAIKGDPAPRVTWYRNNISLNTNTNYHITNVCGVCSILILRVRPKDNGEYKVVIENRLGTAESSMMLNVRGIALSVVFGLTDLTVISCFTLNISLFLSQSEEELQLLITRLNRDILYVCFVCLFAFLIKFNGRLFSLSYCISPATVKYLMVWENITL